MSKSLPPRPSLEQLKNQAKDLLKEAKAGVPGAVQRFLQYRPDGSQRSEAKNPIPSLSLSDAQLVIAREYGFASWPQLKQEVESLLLETGDPIDLLKKAFMADDAPSFRRLLERFPEARAKINEPVGAFDSPLLTQVRSRQMLDVLLEAGADIDAKSQWWAGGFGILHNASPDLATYAIERGAVVDVHAASRLGMLEKLRQLIDADPALVHARGGDGQTPLHFASTIEVARFLLDRGADINARDVDHESTPAQYMIRDRQEVARYLIQRGCATDLLMAAALGDAELVRRHLDAEPQCIHLRVDNEYFPMKNPRAGGTIYQWTLGWHVSAHDVAKQFGHEDVYELLMSRSPADAKLLAACWQADEKAVRSLIAQNPDLVANLATPYRRQVAHAARNNNTAVVRGMLAAGFPVDAVGQHCATPLHWAAFHGNADMARAILAFNPPLEILDSDFQGTPLGWAIHGSEHGWYCSTGDYAATVRLLLQAGSALPQQLEKGTPAVRKTLQEHRRRTSAG